MPVTVIMVMKDPKELAREAAAKAAAEHRKVARRAAIAATSWEKFFQYFQFSDISWLSRKFFERASGVNDSVSIEQAHELVQAWLKYRWGRRGLSNFEVIAEGAINAASKAGIFLETGSIVFYEFVAFLYYYQEFHLSTEPHAGFSDRDVKVFSKVYEKYCRGQDELKARELVAVLGDIGLSFKTVEEQTRREPFACSSSFFSSDCSQRIRR